jgi:hypothetical protein
VERFPETVDVRLGATVIRHERNPNFRTIDPMRIRLRSLVSRQRWFQCGRWETDLPIGIQIVGPYLEDRTPITVAEPIEPEFGGFIPPPGLKTCRQRAARNVLDNCWHVWIASALSAFVCSTSGTLGKRRVSVLCVLHALSSNASV